MMDAIIFRNTKCTLRFESYNYGEVHGMYVALESQDVVQIGIPITNDKNTDVFAALLTDKWMEIAKKQFNL